MLLTKKPELHHRVLQNKIDVVKHITKDKTLISLINDNDVIAIGQNS